MHQEGAHQRVKRPSAGRFAMAPSSKYASVAPMPDDTLRAPMYVMRVADVLKLETIQTHEELKAKGLLVERVDGMCVLFCSHTWLGHRHPDPNGVKCALLKDFLASIVAGTRAIKTHYFAKIVHSKSFDISAKRLQRDLANGYVWLDFWSVPQADTTSQYAAIGAIDQFVARSS